MFQSAPGPQAKRNRLLLPRRSTADDDVSIRSRPTGQEKQLSLFGMSMMRESFNPLPAHRPRETQCQPLNGNPC